METFVRRWVLFVTIAVAANLFLSHRRLPSLLSHDLPQKQPYPFLPLNYSSDSFDKHSFSPQEGQLHGTSRRQELLEACGELCDYQTRPVTIPVPDFGYFGETTAHIDCPSLFATDRLDEPDMSVPHQIPEYFRNDYSMQGKAQIEQWYIRDVYLGKKAKQTVWKYKQIEKWKQFAWDGKFEKFGNYQVIDRETLYDVLKRVARVEGMSVLILGSETPWVEALCLAAGAATTTTLEYGKITSHHPQVHTLTPAEFRAEYQNGLLPQFDVVVSYSSLEHSGLGRYGDALNPWGDIMSLARAYCVTKRHGVLVLGLSSGPDKVYFNAGRIYGIHRWPYMVTNWVRVNYSAHWGPEIMDRAPKLNDRLRGPPGFEIFWNQSSLVFRKSGPPGSMDELPQSQRCPLLGC
jgi:hypothetical protein